VPTTSIVELFLEKEVPLATHVSKFYFFVKPIHFLGTKMGPQGLTYLFGDENGRR